MGNLESLKTSVIDEIENFYEYAWGNEFIPRELVRAMARISGKINRELALYLNRKGGVVAVSVGDYGTVPLPELEGRRNGKRLSGIRCIHTHPDGNGRLSAVDLSSLLELRLDAMIAVGSLRGEVTEIFSALPAADGRTGEVRAEIYGPYGLEDKALEYPGELIAERASSLIFPDREDTALERAILVGVESSSAALLNGRSEGERLLEELAELAGTAGVKVVEKVLQKKRINDSAYHIGKGKVEELALLRQALDAGLLIFDDELTGAQIRNIENTTGMKVIDRTMLILDIFARRAGTSEGKLQVELAQLRYRLPRLTGLGGQLSRLGGGIGTRGPGEKKLEIDRRHIKKRISVLERELRELERRRNMMRASRERSALPTAALVGYTNAGKSTLMNRLCAAEVFVEDKLFATLDPTTRKLEARDGRGLLLIDTVGFIRKLPHELVEAFKSTLEEAVYADALVHVVDASDEEADIHIKVAEELLKELGALNKPIVLALNKTDRLNEASRIPIGLRAGRIVEISALTGRGIDELLKVLWEIIAKNEREVQLTVPYNEGWVMPYVRRNGRVLKEVFTGAGVELTAVVRNQAVDRLSEFLTCPKDSD